MGDLLRGDMMAKVQIQNLENEYGTDFGREVVVTLEKGETYQDGIDALFDALGLDEMRDEDAQYVWGRGNGVWDQLHWEIKEYVPEPDDEA